MEGPIGLFELNTQIKRIVALNFPRPIWITAEINQISNKRGHQYLVLIEKSKDEVIAQVNAVIWAGDHQEITNKLGSTAEQILAVGMQVMMLCMPIVHEKYGYQLRITDINSEFTEGALEKSRRLLFDRIIAERLNQINKLLDLPMVLQRIAIISSRNAAGYIDFVKHLSENNYGFSYSFTLFENSMQGAKIENELLENIAKINASVQDFDVVVIIRGGGSKLDLSGFDHYTLALAIAHCQLPVFTGIGHEMDVSALDLVAHTFFKTPTAVANQLVEHNMEYLSTIKETYSNISKKIIGQVYLSRLEQIKLEQTIKQNILHLITNAKKDLQTINNNWSNGLINKLKESKFDLQLIVNKIQSIDPEQILSLGFVRVIQNDRWIKSLDKLNPKQKIRLQFKDGYFNIES